MFFGTTWRALCCSINQDHCSGETNLSITDLAHVAKQWVPALLRLQVWVGVMHLALLKAVGGNEWKIYCIKDLFETLMCLESKGHPWLIASLLRVQYLPSVWENTLKLFFEFFLKVKEIWGYAKIFCDDTNVYSDKKGSFKYYFKTVTIILNLNIPILLIFKQ